MDHAIVVWHALIIEGDGVGVKLVQGFRGGSGRMVAAARGKCSQ
jgi:hypothetical protein